MEAAGWIQQAAGGCHWRQGLGVMMDRWNPKFRSMGETLLFLRI
jgi:hypothetical protein